MPIKERLAVSFIRLLSKLPLSIARKVGDGLGEVLWAISPKARQSTLINLSIAYPKLSDKSLKKLARRSFKKMCCQAPEFAITWHRDLSWVESHVTSVQGDQFLDEDAPNGTIVLAPHFGNWELLGQYLCTMRDVTAMYAPPKMKAFDAMIFSARERFGVKMVPASAKGVIGLTKALKRGETIIILPDQIPEDGSGVYAPFFGFPAYTMTLASKLARKTDAKVLVAAALPCPSGWRVEIGLASELIKSENDQEAAKALNQTIETFISQSPEFYQWEYKRYRKMADDTIRIYDR